MAVGIRRWFWAGVGVVGLLGSSCGGADEQVVEIGPSPPPSSSGVSIDQSVPSLPFVTLVSSSTSPPRPTTTVENSPSTTRVPTKGTPSTSLRRSTLDQSNSADGSEGGTRGSAGGGTGDQAPSTAPRAVRLVLDHFEIDDLQDGLVGADEVSFLVIPIGEAAPAGSHVDLGAIRRGSRLEPQLDLVIYPEPNGLISVQVAAVERDSDGFKELFAQFLGGVDRLLTATTSLDVLDTASLGRSQDEILALTLDDLTADDGQLVNDHDLVGICWLTLDLGDDELQSDVTSGVDCDGRTDAETVRLTFFGERGQWTAGLSWRLTQ